MSHNRRWNERCKVCQKRKPPSKPIREAMAQYNVGATLERIALDIMGPLPQTQKGHKYILAITDYFRNGQKPTPW